MEDKSGVYSLAGFAYQILVFALFIPNMQEGDSIFFETIDDVETKLSQTDLDDKENVFTICRKHRSIQVKKTDITVGKAEKIVKNWMLTEIEKKNIDEYLLYTDRAGVDVNIFEKVSVPKIVDEIVMADEKATSINMRLKKYKDKDLKKACGSVIKKAKVKIIADFGVELKNAYARFFLCSAVYKFTYVERIKSLLNVLTVEILEKIIKGESYCLEFEHVEKIQNEIIQSITNTNFLPCYSDFRKTNDINLSDLAISSSREYKQLCACDLSEKSMKDNLSMGLYYESCKFGYYEAGKQKIVDDIEITAYENFCETKENLQWDKKDTPRNRLRETKNMPNEYAKTKQIRCGVCISLTKDNVKPNLKISWKD